MPRKTGLGRVSDGLAAVLASMRPRPDAAENRITFTAVDAGAAGLQ